MLMHSWTPPSVQPVLLLMIHDFVMILCRHVRIYKKSGPPLCRLSISIQTPVKNTKPQPGSLV